MRISRRFSLATFVATAALSIGLAAPAVAAPQQEGLVNVNVSDVNAQIPIGVAANVCDVTANVLASGNLDDADDCYIDQDGNVVLEDDGSGDSPTQEGLVNVNVSDVNVQVPVTVAANVCDVTVNALASDNLDAADDCTIDQDGDVILEQV